MEILQQNIVTVQIPRGELLAILAKAIEDKLNVKVTVIDYMHTTVNNGTELALSCKCELRQHELHI